MAWRPVIFPVSEDSTLVRSGMSLGQFKQLVLEVAHKVSVVSGCFLHFRVLDPGGRRLVLRFVG
jgi:hypothetical protein